MDVAKPEMIDEPVSLYEGVLQGSDMAWLLIYYWSFVKKDLTWFDDKGKRETCFSVL